MVFCHFYSFLLYLCPELLQGLAHWGLISRVYRELSEKEKIGSELQSPWHKRSKKNEQTASS